ncbi:AzlD domain-containing protein [Pelistega europaea]|uniref:AzlD domain-containing protein n=1 Tax=Pelistega europaea TaxID=106147 RepID=A0A7Y4P3N4_9BURK|nr:AzlD domain-containing protein [Pelistega europaea]NOL49197.1 AzlD domain-containing protein [Pelistega europaea]
MVSNIPTWQLMLAIAAMAILTYSTRAMPFILMKKAKWLGRLGSGKLAILGPALLSSTTVVILYSESIKAQQQQQIIPYILAVVSVLVILKLTRNIGLAMLVSLIVYGLGLSVL